ncbi:MAG: Mu transposase C-terminal domain-containing protein [Rhodobacteraceae bacterium]|nr:Mu transposase C-terminal domain-containing protein [Paracoccaceae bacterium]
MIWPDGTINRPQIVAFQDLYSGKTLSWRVDHDPNSVMVMAAFGEMIEKFGKPGRCLFDNGHEFANKWLTGGSKTRFRFKIRDDDPLGVLPLLGIKQHWATPAHGQAKPIERAFGDFARNIAKDPRFHGAYVGNSPMAKPENFGERAIPAATFLKVLAEGIIKHNAREGRLSKTAQGRSFDETFAESFATVPIRPATEEQRRLWLMGQQVAKLNKDNGQLRLYNNYYHSDWMSQHPSKKIVARFDPENLHSGVYIYDADGAFMGFAECRQAVGFFDVTGAKELARRKSRIKRAEKALVEAHRPISIEQIGCDMDALAPESPEALEAKVVSPMFGQKPAPIIFDTPSYSRVEDDDRVAMASIGQALGAAIDDNVALIVAERLVRTTETSALAQDVVDLAASLTTAESDIVAQVTATNQLIVRVTDNEGVFAGISQSITTLTSSIGDNTASITDQSTTTDGIMAEQTIALDVNGHISGLILRAEIGSGGAVISTAAFVADKFAIVGPGGAPETPFVVYTTPQTIGGKTVPPGVYMTTAFIHDGFINSAMIGNAEIGNAQIAGILQSADYAQDGDGVPTNGIKINFSNGVMKLAGPVFSRELVIASGSFTVAAGIGNGATVRFPFVNTGVRIGQDDVWQLPKRVFVATARVVPGVGSNVNNASLWAAKAEVLNGAAWFGAANWGSSKGLLNAWSEDPATLVNPAWRSGNDQRILLTIEAETSSLTISGPITVHWKLNEVT